jgi:hypothetical protein
MRVVRSTPPAFQMNLEDRRPFCNTVLRQYPIGHHGVTMANHRTTLPGSPTKNPEGFGRSQRIDQYGLRPIRPTPPALQTNPDDSRPFRETVLQRNPIGHHRAKWRTTARLCLGAQLKNPKIRPDPERTDQFGLRPIWMKFHPVLEFRLTSPEGEPPLSNSTTYTPAG